MSFFPSSTARQAKDMFKHVRKLLNAQRDILSPAAVSALETALAEVKQALGAGADDATLQKLATNLENAANKNLKTYPSPGIRENVEVLLVALAVAMGIRTFFLQPFKIPTGSMQPTLFGVTPSPGPGAQNQPDLKIPGAIAGFFDYWIHGVSYFNIVAPEDGQLETVSAPTKLLLFNLKQKYTFNGHPYTVWFPVDDLFRRAGYYVDLLGNVSGSPTFKAGEMVVRLKAVAGDYLFVDRLTYNFRHPKRGEIIVFETRGIGNEFHSLPDDQFYIKRLVALGNERVQIGEDRHLVINGQRLDASTPHFDNIYSFDPKQPPQESHYSGHKRTGEVFNESNDYTVTTRPDHYMVMGDNTMNSLDSRYWGDFSRTNVVGKYFFVYWPFTSRFGMSVH